MRALHIKLQYVCLCIILLADVAFDLMAYSDESTAASEINVVADELAVTAQSRQPTNDFYAMNPYCKDAKYGKCRRYCRKVENRNGTCNRTTWKCDCF